MPYTRWSPNFTAFEIYQSEIDTQAAKRLAPFIELGMTLAKTVPGWHKG